MAEPLLSDGEWAEILGGPCDGQLYEIPRGAKTVRVLLFPGRQVTVFVSKERTSDGHRIARWTERWPE